jgi:predicted nucleotidyltransferase
VPYNLRASVLTNYGIPVVTWKSEQYFARYKQVFPKSDFVAYLPGRRSFLQLSEQLGGTLGSLPPDIVDVEKLLGIKLSDVNLGLTGGLLLGNHIGFHDFDLVFQGSLDQNLIIAKTMKSLVSVQHHRRVIEGGKGWNIRFYNDRGTFICNFFGYRNIAQAPLHDFSMHVLSEDVLIEGVVLDDTHTMYTPTMLGLTSVTSRENLPSELKLIAYHTATRGECFQGDRIRARGAFVIVTTPTEEYSALCTIEREGIRNLTPTWDGFYEDSGLV